MSKLKKRVFIIGAVACIVLIISASIGINAYNHTSKRLYEINWEITLPKKIHLEFERSTEPSFHGDGLRYTVFSSKNEISKDFLADFTEKDIECFREEIYAYLEMLEIPTENHPDFEHSCCVKKMEMYANKLYLLYDKDNNLLYAVQWMQ